MSTKVIENSTTLRKDFEMRAGAAFRYNLEHQFPLHGGEKRASWFFRVSRATGIPSKRLEKLSYDEKCALRAHEIIKLQEAVSGQISELTNNAARLKTRRQEIGNEAIKELRGLCHQILEAIGKDSTNPSE